MLGGTGDDVIDVGGGVNVVVGDNGSVTAVEAATSDADFGGADAITTGDGDDTVLGGSGGDYIVAAGGNNRIVADNGRITADVAETTDPGFGADDAVVTGHGDDIVLGGGGSDVIWVGAGRNVIIGDGGRVTATTACDHRPRGRRQRRDHRRRRRRLGARRIRRRHDHGVERQQPRRR